MNPSAASPADVSMLTKERIEAVCSEFKRAWQTARSPAERPSIEHYVAGDRCPERSSLLAELIMLDLELRRPMAIRPIERSTMHAFRTIPRRSGGRSSGWRMSRIPWPRKGWLKPCNACRRVIGP